MLVLPALVVNGEDAAGSCVTMVRGGILAAEAKGVALRNLQKTNQLLGQYPCKFTNCTVMSQIVLHCVGCFCIVVWFLFFLVVVAVSYTFDHLLFHFDFYMSVYLAFFLEGTLVLGQRVFMAAVSVFWSTAFWRFDGFFCLPVFCLLVHQETWIFPFFSYFPL